MIGSASLPFSSFKKNGDRMPRAGVNGMNLYYEDTGGDGPVAVFSHGLLMDADMFAHQIHVLRANYRCISWDQRGFGRTGPVSEPFSYWTSANDVLSLMSALDIGTAALVGLSQGGFLSMRAALLAPERISALILLATHSGLDSLETIDSFKALRSEWIKNGSTNVQAGLGSVLLGPDVDTRPWFEKWTSMGRNDMTYPLNALTDRDDITATLERLRCPSLVIHGTADIAIDIEHGRLLAADLPGCRTFCEVEGAGYAVNLARPSQFTGKLFAFLEPLV